MDPPMVARCALARCRAKTLQLRNRDGRAPLFRVVTHLFSFMRRIGEALVLRPSSSFAGTSAFAG
jgi:hypothetical protein